MVRHQVFAALLVFYLQVKFLKEQHPSYESWFGLFLGEQVFQGRMISVDDYLAPQDIRPELCSRWPSASCPVAAPGPLPPRSPKRRT